MAEVISGIIPMKAYPHIAKWHISEKDYSYICSAKCALPHLHLNKLYNIRSVVRGESKSGCLKTTNNGLVKTHKLGNVRMRVVQAAH